MDCYSSKIGTIRIRDYAPLPEISDNLANASKIQIPTSQRRMEKDFNFAKRGEMSAQMLHQDKK